MFGRLAGSLRGSRSGISSGRSASQEPSSPSSPSGGSPGEAVILFDWDDTLFPSWWRNAVMKPSLVRVDASHYDEVLCSHARAVEAVLRSAREVAKVEIVTLANKAR